MKQKIDKYHKHEAVDRSFIIMEMFVDYLYEHPVIEQNKKCKKLSKKIIDNMYKLYSLTSEIRFNKKSKENRNEQ